MLRGPVSELPFLVALVSVGSFLEPVSESIGCGSDRANPRQGRIAVFEEPVLTRCHRLTSFRSEPVLFSAKGGTGSGC